MLMQGKVDIVPRGVTISILSSERYLGVKSNVLLFGLLEPDPRLLVRMLNVKTGLN